MAVWLSLGLDYDLFWRLTPGEASRTARGVLRREERLMETQRALNHEMAGLIFLAFHKPRHLPKYKPLKERGREVTRAATEADHTVIKAYFRKLASQGKG